jgi:DNA-binding response OmpR family regulator
MTNREHNGMERTGETSWRGRHEPLGGMLNPDPQDTGMHHPGIDALHLDNAGDGTMQYDGISGSGVPQAGGDGGAGMASWGAVGGSGGVGNSGSSNAPLSASNSGGSHMGTALSGAAGSLAGGGMSRRILVVEDERDLASMLEYNLKRAGYLPIVWHDGARALEMAKSAPPDLVILDLMLPGMPGLEVARHLRSHVSTQAIPILMLTARAEETDQVAGLAAGADDYVTKPFSMKVLLARVEALLRRAAPINADGSAGLITVGLIVADPSSHVVTVEGQIIKLTLTEFRLLLALLQSPKRVLSRNELIARVMGPGIVVTARTIDVHVASIRKKLNAAGGQIRTIRGVGYQLGTEAEANAEMG